MWQEFLFIRLSSRVNSKWLTSRQKRERKNRFYRIRFIHQWAAARCFLFHVINRKPAALCHAGVCECVCEKCRTGFSLLIKSTAVFLRIGNLSFVLFFKTIESSLSRSAGEAPQLGGTWSWSWAEGFCVLSSSWVCVRCGGSALRLKLTITTSWKCGRAQTVSLLFYKKKMF